MDTEYLSFYYGNNAQIVKHLCAVLPGDGITVLSDGLIVESIHCRNLSSFVVSSQQCNESWILQFQAQQQLESLNRVVPTIHEVAHDYVSCVGYLPTLGEELKKIVELAVDVTADGDWSLHWLNVALLNEKLFHFLTQNAKVALRQNVAALHSLEPLVDVCLPTHLFFLTIIYRFDI